MEAKAKGEYETSTASLFKGVFKPYIFYEGPLTPYLNFRLDSTFDSAKNSIARFGTDVLARYGRLHAGPLYDTLQMTEGRQSNLALSVVYALQESGMPGYANLLPKVTGRYGA
jgi:hypothetical protein